MDAGCGRHRLEPSAVTRALVYLGAGAVIWLLAWLLYVAVVALATGAL
jgi:hypothetical protein